MGEKPWTGERIRALRRHLGLSQARFGRELGIRQATVSEWETGLYQPRGASARLLSLVAERAEFYRPEMSRGLGPDDAKREDEP